MKPDMNEVEEELMSALAFIKGYLEDDRDGKWGTPLITEDGVKRRDAMLERIEKAFNVLKKNRET